MAISQDKHIKLETIIAIRSSVIDVQFSETSPSIHNQLLAGPKGEVVIEVVKHLDNQIVSRQSMVDQKG